MSRALALLCLAACAAPARPPMPDVAGDVTRLAERVDRKAALDMALRRSEISQQLAMRAKTRPTRQRARPAWIAAQADLRAALREGR